jgi:hypothetical protein
MEQYRDIVKKHTSFTLDLLKVKRARHLQSLPPFCIPSLVCSFHWDVPFQRPLVPCLHLLQQSPSHAL